MVEVRGLLPLPVGQIPGREGVCEVPCLCGGYVDVGEEQPDRVRVYPYSCPDTVSDACTDGAADTVADCESDTESDTHAHTTSYAVSDSGHSHRRINIYIRVCTAKCDGSSGTDSGAVVVDSR